MKHFTTREMVRDLLSEGLTQQQIAEKVSVSQATIARVRKGSDMRYEAGKRLGELHRRMCPDKYRTSTPKLTPGQAPVTTA